jgi:putative transcriptional regulator
MIRVNLDELVKAREITMYRLAKDTGVTYPTLWKLQTGRAQRIGFDVIEKLCVYLECSPGDLLSVIPEKSGKDRASKKVSESGKSSKK